MAAHNVVVVGAGLSGAVVARHHAEKGDRVLVVESRPHIAGNCFDYTEDRTGYRVALYGPHLFHTNNEHVWKYVNRFAHWTPWEHRVLSRVKLPGGSFKDVPVPVNRTTLNALFDAGVQTDAEAAAWLERETIPCAAPANSKEVSLARVGPRLYDMLFRGYTVKQWDKDPTELGAEVMARIPVRVNADDRYFTDTYQALPTRGYTDFVGSILNHPLIEVRTSTDFHSEEQCLANRQKLYYTGRIDRYFAWRGYDALEYRSLDFSTEYVPIDSPTATVYPASQVNFPDVATPFTRLTEYKHLLHQRPREGAPLESIVVKEYSKAGGDAYYPVPNKRNQDLYAKYQALTAEFSPEVTFVGRLASYRYQNMDQAIFSALQTVGDVC